MGEHIKEFGQTAALGVVALLPLINPLGSAPIFLSMTPGASAATRAALARRIAANAWLLLVGAMLVGSYVLSFFGLSLSVVKIAGGLLVIATGWHLIGAEQTPDAKGVTLTPVWGDAEIASRGFYPLTFPLTIGPGSVSVAMTLGAQARAHDHGPLIAIAGALTGLLLVALAILVCYLFASRLTEVLGRTGTVILLRLSAFFLLCVGVQIFCEGVVERFTPVAGGLR